MKRLGYLLTPVLLVLLYSSSAAYLGLSLDEMKRRFGEPVKKEGADTYTFEWRAKRDNRRLRVNSGDLIRVEAVIRGGRVARETIRLPNKLDTQKEILNWVWTYSGGKIRKINSPRTKAIAAMGGQKAYYFGGGYWAIPRIDPRDGRVMAIIVGRE